ncbi:MAG: site-specific DNA-methyltransferase, partial [candidate division WOR-3 bacterium]
MQKIKEENKKHKNIGKFQLDEIYCGDALELIKEIPDEIIDLIITDPPFAIDFKAKKNNYNRTQKRVLEGYVEIPKEKYYKFTLNWMREC